MRSTSPSTESVSVQDANYQALPGSAAFDAHGLQLYEWSHPFKSTDDVCGGPHELRYVALASLQMAQIEAVVGVASYRRSLAVFLTLWVANVLASLALALSPLWKKLLSGGPFVAIIVGLAIVTLVLSAVTKWRVATTRRTARLRFSIAGDFADDRRTVDWNQGRAIRQMARHVHCDRTRLFATPLQLQQ